MRENIRSIRKCSIPANSLLEKYAGNGGYADCYCADAAGSVIFAEFVFAFYTTALFKLERWILGWSISRPSTDAQAKELATGTGQSFAAWHVEARRDHELLMCDLNDRTRSWLMSVVIDDSRTRIYFGSAVVPALDPKTGKASLGFVYRSLLGLHQIYSVLLLYCAAHRLTRMARVTRT